MSKKIYTEQEVMAWSQKQRVILRNFRRVKIDSKDMHSRLNRSFDESDEEDVHIDEKGSELLHRLKDRFYQFEDPYYKERLITLWGQSHIDNQLNSFVRKKTFVRNIPHDLLRAKRHKWTIFVGLKNIHLKKKIDFDLAVFHPLGFPGNEKITKKMRKSFTELGECPYVEIRGIEAPTIFYAGLNALEKTQSFLALIPNKHKSLSYKEDVRFAGYIIGYNSTSKAWTREWQIPHKGLLLTEQEEAILKDFGKTLKETRKRRSDLAKRVLDITAMLFSSKTVQYPPAKLLLLVTVMEALLLEESFNKTAEYKKINLLAQSGAKNRKGQPISKVKKGVFFHARLTRFCEKYFKMNDPMTKRTLAFLNELYDQRSEVTHLCSKHRLEDQEVQILEGCCLNLLKELCKSKGKTHLAALRLIGAVDGKI